MSPKLYRELHLAPKPMEISCSSYESAEDIKKELAPKNPKDKGVKLDEKKLRLRDRLWGVKKLRLKAQNIKDALRKHPKPQVMTTNACVIPQ